MRIKTGRKLALTVLNGGRFCRKLMFTATVALRGEERGGKKEKAEV
jgi:hypothetical protein